MGTLRKVTQIRFDKTPVIPALQCESETLALREREESITQSAKVTFLRSVKGCFRSVR